MVESISLKQFGYNFCGPVVYRYIKEVSEFLDTIPAHDLVIIAGDLNAHLGVDLCGVCGGMDDCVDCGGVPYGGAFLNGCDNVDIYGNPDADGVGDCACGYDGNHAGEAIESTCLLDVVCTIDCFGTPGGTKEVDECGVCREPDCTGLGPPQPNYTELNNPCSTGEYPTNLNWNSSCIDCYNQINGEGFIDQCDNCSGLNIVYRSVPVRTTYSQH